MVQSLHNLTNDCTISLNADAAGLQLNDFRFKSLYLFFPLFKVVIGIVVDHCLQNLLAKQVVQSTLELLLHFDNIIIDFCELFHSVFVVVSYRFEQRSFNIV
jgi:hypothetical protein